MEVYLIRHGIAAQRGTYTKDTERPLTKKGISKTTKVAQRLLEVGISFEHILSSPLVRAYQTAEILINTGLGKQITLYKPLAISGDIELWLQWLNDNYNEESQIALIGHQPDLAYWTEMLVFGNICDCITLKKAGIIGIKILNETEPIGNSELFLLTSPKWFI